MDKQVRIGVDIGGTFTDIALEAGDRLFTLKVLTTDAQPERGVIEGLCEVITEARVNLSEVALIIHGTTLATNALIQRNGARTAFITTEGFRDVVEIGSEGRYEQYDLDIDLPEPLVPRSLRVPIRERIAANGDVLLPLDLDGIDQLIDVLVAEQVESVAVGLLHSYANPVHEQRIRDHFHSRLPGLMFSLSSEVAPEMREFERFSTTCANAYVQPLMASYLERLQRDLTAMGFQCPLFLMHSGGGMLDVDTAIRFPVRLVESGPAGGAIFASHVASTGGFDKVLSLDVGGTTAKICLIEDGRPQTDRVFEVARTYKYRKGSGTPLLIPVIDMVEIGTGGGSIAHLDTLGRIAVGPESAGAEPGPACYGRGGENPTVTDANLIAGRLAAVGFAGGRMDLDVKAAKRALDASLGEPLALSSELSALATIEMVDENMANASRSHAVESGKDLARYTLIAFGGCAPVHATALARKLGIVRIVIPPGAGVGSAIGFLRAPFAYEAVRSGYFALRDFDLEFANDLLNELSSEAHTMVARGAGTGGEAALVEELRYAYMRYQGQGYDIRVPLPATELGAEDVGLLEQRFNTEYTALFGQPIPGIGVEVLTWSVLVRTQRAVPRKSPTVLQRKSVASTDERQLLDSKGHYQSVAVYERDTLDIGAVIDGPAVVTEAQTTTVVSTEWRAFVDENGFVVISAE